jgi:hypothetical protein
LATNVLALHDKRGYSKQDFFMKMATELTIGRLVAEPSAVLRAHRTRSVSTLKGTRECFMSARRVQHYVKHMQALGLKR